ncbi:MAG TPA: acyltransferase [Polyangiaceae bacterium]|nr:acyltransferase [Polyangiaceae bacterium]
MNDSRPWLERVPSWALRVPSLARAAFEEIDPLLSRRVLAQGAAAVFPQQSFNRTRTALLRAAGMRIGARSLIQGPLHVTGQGNNPCQYLSIGEYTIITGPLHVDLGAPVTIGNNVRIGHDVSLLTVDHAIGEEWLRSGLSQFAGIDIGDGAWIASRVTVLPKVSIGAGSVVAAGAVVTRNVEPNTLVAGVPARFIRSLSVGA